MSNEEKDLLLKDLSSRVPYGVKLSIDYDFLKEKGLDVQTLISVDVYDMIIFIENNWYDIEKVKPYLRPLSSMTFEERKIYYKIMRDILREDVLVGLPIFEDFLNKNHLDFRGLIEKGLAIEVTEENNPYK